MWKEARVAACGAECVESGQLVHPVDDAEVEIDGDDGLLEDVARETGVRDKALLDGGDVLDRLLAVDNDVGDGVGVSRGEEDLATLGVDGGLAAPHADAGPAHGRGRFGDHGQVPDDGESLGRFVEAEGGDVADKVAAFVSRIEGEVLLDAGGADEELAVVKGGGHGDDGKGVWVELNGAEGFSCGSVDGEDECVRQGAKVHDVAVDLRAGSRNGTYICALGSREGFPAGNEFRHVNLPAHLA